MLPARFSEVAHAESWQRIGTGNLRAARFIIERSRDRAAAANTGVK